jgi:hypothetical protein
LRRIVGDEGDGRYHADTHDQNGRADLYQRLVDTIDQATG